MSESEFDAVCVGAHPDDVEIGMGGTIALMVSSGWRIAIVDLTNGEPTPHGTPEKRAAEAARAAQILGVERRTLALPNRYLFDSVEARVELAEVLRELRPRTLFIPYSEDAHPDHVAAAHICEAARSYAKFTKTDMSGEPFYPERVYRYMAVHLRLAAEPSFIVALSERDIDTKLSALAAYESQFAANPANSDVLELMRRSAAMWGALGRTAAGEPFFCVEPLAISSLEALV